MRRVKEVERRHVTRLCFQPDLTLTLEDLEVRRSSSSGDESAVTAILSGTMLIQKEGEEDFLLEITPGDETPQEMDALPKYRFIYGARVERCTVEEGTLALEFEQGVLKVKPFYEVEAWEMYNDKGFRMICMPGGEVAVWSEDSLEISPGGDGASAS